LATDTMQRIETGLRSFSAQNPTLDRVAADLQRLRPGITGQAESVTNIENSMGKLRSQLKAMQRCGRRAAMSAAGRRPGVAGPAAPRAGARPQGALFLNNERLDVTVLALAGGQQAGGAQILRSGKPFAPQVLQELLSRVRPGSTVVDTDCNSGSYAVFFAAKVGPRGAVHCFEPQRKLAQLAGANALVNGFSSVVRVHNAALSFAGGAIRISSESPGPKASRGSLFVAKGGEEVQAVTLDSFKLKDVSLIRVQSWGTADFFSSLEYTENRDDSKVLQEPPQKAAPKEGAGAQEVGAAEEEAPAEKRGGKGGAAAADDEAAGEGAGAGGDGKARKRGGRSRGRRVKPPVEVEEAGAGEDAAAAEEEGVEDAGAGAEAKGDAAAEDEEGGEEGEPAAAEEEEEEGGASKKAAAEDEGAGEEDGGGDEEAAAEEDEEEPAADADERRRLSRRALSR
ncbi:hypothetical protein MNEG_11097, partial [Monoraphidium neglectum]